MKRKNSTPERGMLYRLGHHVFLRPTHYASSLVTPLGFGALVVFLGFHKSGNHLANVMSGEQIGWITVPRKLQKKHQFWRKVKC